MKAPKPGKNPKFDADFERVFASMTKDGIFGPEDAPGKRNELWQFDLPRYPSKDERRIQKLKRKCRRLEREKIQMEIEMGKIKRDLQLAKEYADNLADDWRCHDCACKRS